MRSHKKTIGARRHASKASVRRKVRSAKGARAIAAPKKAVVRKAVGRKKTPARAKAKPELARRLVRVIVEGLEDASAKNVVALFPKVPALGRKIRKIVADAAGAADALRGEGLRLADEAESRRIEAALGRARARGEAAVAEILSRPEMLTGEAFAERANTSRETVNRWRKEGRVLGLEGNTRGVRYPAWQIDERGLLLRELRAFLEAVGDPWVAYRFLTETLPEFGGLTGLEALKRGRAAELVDVVRHFGETY